MTREESPVGPLLAQLTGPSWADHGAEMAALGSILMAPNPAEIAALVFTAAPADEFWREGELARVLEGMWRAGRPIDPQLLLEELTTQGIVQRVGGGPHLHDLIERAYAPSNAGFYADTIHAAYRRRSLSRAAIRTLQQTENPTTDMGSVAIELMGAAEAVFDAGRVKATTPPQDVLDFIEGPSSYDWIVPGLLERLDRLMLVAPEGLAKSVVLAQIAAAVSVGRHPFTNEEVEPRRALVIDCEVNPRQQRRRWRWLVDVAEKMGCPVKPETLWVEPRPDGLDLTGPDLSWVKAKVRAAGADLIVIGPLYRLHRHNINDEEVARELVASLDDIRLGGNAALLVEAHAGHQQQGFRGERELRPRGSSLFMGWTEFGIGLRPVKGDRRLCDVVRWRGDRDMRKWPEKIRWGTGLTWPWVEAAPDATSWT